MGAIDLLERVMATLDDLPHRLRRQGEPGVLGPQERNVLVVDLARWERGPHYPAAGDDTAIVLAEDHALLATATTLQRLAPLLAGLDRSRCTAELYVSTIREEDQGGFELPAELVAAAAAAALSIGVSILVLLPEEESDGTSEGQDTGYSSGLAVWRTTTATYTQMGT